MHINAWFPNFTQRAFFPALLKIESGKISTIQAIDQSGLSNKQLDAWPYILPPLVDAHVHIESSMLTPFRFAEEAARHGTVATVSDPHEIANVIGLEGCNFMSKNAQKSGLKIFFTAPSCVPATPYETAGSTLGADELDKLQKEINWVALGEMMNFPGVLIQETEVEAKLSLAKRLKKPIDGHAPGLGGDDLKKYIQAGISTDHEAVTLAEAREKIQAGMKILIREGSAAKNFDELAPLIDEFPDQVMLCSDDLHPDDLIRGHINLLLKRGVQKGLDLFNLLQAASSNPVNHYQLPVGQLRVGDPADFVVVKDLKEFAVIATYVNGRDQIDVSGNLLQQAPEENPAALPHFAFKPKDFEFLGSSGTYRIIVAQDESLLTGDEIHLLQATKGLVQPDLDQDIMKLVVVNRYQFSKPQVGWIKGFGLRKGAIAGSIAHDSHNILAVGTDDRSICEAVNEVFSIGGGIALTDNHKLSSLSLSVAGLMSNRSASEVAALYQDLTQQACALGSTLRAPFMTLSFMALLVIPALKLGDQGLFDVNQFKFVDPFVGS